MSLSAAECTAHIAHFSALFADATRDNLDGRVEHCPDWSVADLVWHLTEVHWFWATIAEERPSAPPDGSRRPERGPDDRLVADFVAGARRLVDVLATVDPQTPCWTWAPGHQDVAFVTRHQVQEAAVHHWDVANAAGQRIEIAPEVAADAVEEFLTVSVSSEARPADPPRPPLDGAIWICACAGDGPTAPTWLVTDGATAGTVAWRRLPEGVAAGDVVADRPTTGGHADPADVLLWLYGRTPVPWIAHDAADVNIPLLERFRALTYTD
jgi:uncharacterized protein (TIGR03083 family)